MSSLSKDNLYRWTGILCSMLCSILCSMLVLELTYGDSRVDRTDLELY